MQRDFDSLNIPAPEIVQAPEPYFFDLPLSSSMVDIQKNEPEQYSYKPHSVLYPEDTRTIIEKQKMEKNIWRKVLKTQKRFNEVNITRNYQQQEKPRERKINW